MALISVEELVDLTPGQEQNGLDFQRNTVVHQCTTVSEFQLAGMGSDTPEHTHALGTVADLSVVASAPCLRVFLVVRRCYRSDSRAGLEDKKKQFLPLVNIYCSALT